MKSVCVTQWILGLLFGLFLLSCNAESNRTRCDNDSDCKNNRICVNNFCRPTSDAHVQDSHVSENLEDIQNESTCTPDCFGRSCGPDPVCGDLCGPICPSGEYCLEGICEPGLCTPDCTLIECGPDPLCGESCGSCTTDFYCVEGICENEICIPECMDQECGQDPVCGQECGICSFGYYCEDGQCIEEECVSDCFALECGSDPICGELCGLCSDGYYCEDGQCIEEDCVPNCNNRECGLDPVCSQSCGFCSTGICDSLGQCRTGDVLQVDCNVHTILDESQMTDITYMTTHFNALIQEFCIIGAINGVELNDYSNKMFYGTHNSENTVSLNQISMGPSPNLELQYSIKINFTPDYLLDAGVQWPVGIGVDDIEASVIIIEHMEESAQCIFGTGTSGMLTVQSAFDTTSIEGGSFHITGQIFVQVPWNLPGYCDNTLENYPCCS